jgi:molybdate transport system ATP-binding protein
MLAVDIEAQRGDFSLSLRFQAEAASVVALFGRSGCGKTTVIDLIAGLLRPKRGSVQLAGRTLFDAARGIDLPVEQRRIGYVFQDARLFPHYSLLGNLRYGQRRHRDSAPVIDLETVLELLGLRPLVQRRVQQLSGGEKQRVAIGRALLAQPQLLLLDEPLASLDLPRRAEVLPYLEQVRDYLRIPMVYVSHQFDEVLRLATQVVVLDQGHALLQGDIAAVSLRRELRELVGGEATGAVVDGQVEEVDPAGGLARVRIGAGQISVDVGALGAGQQVRVQMLARDLVLALSRPTDLSIRNALAGTVTTLENDGAHAILVGVDVGGATLLARVTASAARDLQLRAGLPLWALVKAVSLRGRVFATAPKAP